MKILFLSHRVPYPPNRGDRIRSFNLIRYLSERAEVDLAFLTEQAVESDTRAELENRCRRVTWARLPRRGRWLHAATSLLRGRTATEGLFHSRQLHQTLASWSQETSYDAVVIYCSSMFQYLPTIAAMVDRNAHRLQVLVDLVDVDSQKWFDYAAQSRGLKRWLFRLEGSRLRRLECRIPSEAGAVILVSEAEAALFRGFCKLGFVQAIPNGVDLGYFSGATGDKLHEPRDEQTLGAGSSLHSSPEKFPISPAEAARTCVFVGALDYRANIDGVTWFVREVWPDVRRRWPGAKFHLVGSNPRPTMRELARSPGVELIGQVPDVRQYLAAADVVVAPLRVARGIQNKVLEALAMRKAVVASPEALEGLRVEPGIHARQASTPSEWSDAITNLFADEHERTRLGAAGRRYVESHHSWDVCLSPLAELLDRETKKVTPSTGDSRLATP